MLAVMNYYVNKNIDIDIKGILVEKNVECTEELRVAYGKWIEEVRYYY